MQKLFSGGLKEWILMILAAAVLLAALIFPVKYALANPLTKEEQRLVDAYQHNEIIRIHVIANSDSPGDQALKYKVRDALIDAFGTLLVHSGAQSSEMAFQALQLNEQAMLRTAMECANANGFDGTLRSETGLLDLPAKQYGSVTLPEGEYRALRIIIGEGRGENWWCVLYPQLCLALSEPELPMEPFQNSRRILRSWLLMGK